MARFVVAGLLVAVLLAGCESHSKERAQEAIDDASISAAVQAKLTADRSSNFALVSVDSDRGVVHLTGVVASAEQRKRAEELSHQVKGVTQVRSRNFYWIAARHWFVDSMLPVGHIVSCRGIGGLR